MNKQQDLKVIQRERIWTRARSRELEHTCDETEHPPAGAQRLSCEDMYVLCTLAVLTLHSLFKSRNKREQSRPSEAVGREAHLKNGGTSEGRWGASSTRHRVDGSGKRRRGGVRSLANSRKQVQVRRKRRLV